MFLYLLSITSLPSLALGAQQVPVSNPTSSPFTAGFDKLVTQNLNHWHTPGLAVAVLHGDDTFSKGYGVATFPDKPVTPETLFYTASTTKSFTAAAVSLLIDESANSSQRLSWQVPLAKVMREDFVLADEYATSHVTVEDALSHRTGMRRHDLSHSEANVTVRDVVRNLRHLPMTAEIRSRFQYCNLMYIAISHFIETWTGMWLGDFLRTRIYEPLSMASTFFSLSDAQNASASGGPSLATPYYWNNKTREYHGFPWLDAPETSGCGATISNVLDYAKWLRCMMTMAAPLSPAGHQNLRLPRIFTGPVAEEESGFRGSSAYAIGWEISNYRGEVLIWHTGGLPGFGSIMMYLPRLQWGVTMMTTDGQGFAMQVLVFKLIDDMLAIPECERYDWVPMLELRAKQKVETLKNARQLLYPHAPPDKDSIPLSLPLDSYAGIYTNKGYSSLTLTLNSTTVSHTSSQPQQVLHSVTHYGQYPISLSFEHVSGEFFLIFTRWLSTEVRTGIDAAEPATDEVTKAEFRLGEDGKVKEMGVLLDREMGKAKIWFRKAGAEDNDGVENDFAAGSSAVKAENSHDGSSAGGQKSLFSRMGQEMAPLFARHA